jgi:hypothetical protein
MDIANCSPTALAAIEMCESLMLTLVDKGLLTTDDVAEMLEIVTSAKQVEAEEESSPVHRRAGEITEFIKISVASASTRSTCNVVEDTAATRSRRSPADLDASLRSYQTA